MEKAEVYGRAIRASLAFTGTSREELAGRLGIHLDTLGRKIREPGEFKLKELAKADEVIGWSHFMKGEKA